MDWDILGHEWAVSLLREHIARGRLRHAYLITGPEGVGRRTLALRLAQALNCTQQPAPGVPCRTCRNCRLIEQQAHPDLAIVEAESRGGTLKVDQIRELQRSLALAPYEAKYRIAVLLRFEEANDSASNALLKTLEEPPGQSVLILTAQDAESLLPTIVSRCEIIRLRLVPVEQVQAGLQQRWNLGEERARFLAHVSGGRPGYALWLHLDADQLGQRRVWLDDLAELLASGRVNRFAYADKLSKDRDQLRSALQVWLSFWRDVMLQAAGSASPVSNLDCSGEIHLLADRLSLQAVQGVVAAVERTVGMVEVNVNPRLAVEVLMLDLPRIQVIHDSPSAN